MKAKIKKLWKTFLNAKIAFLVATFNTIFLVWLFVDSIEISLRNLIAFSFGFLPSIYFYYRVYIANKKKEKRKKINIISIVSIIPYIIYFIIWFFIFCVNSVETPETMLISYKKYFSIFPNNIREFKKDAKYYHQSRLFGNMEILYLKTNDEFITKYIEEYKDKTIHLHEDDKLNYDNINKSLNTQVTDDFDLYIIESNCDDSGYCNHGNTEYFLINEDTNEIIFYGSSW